MEKLSRAVLGVCAAWLAAGLPAGARAWTRPGHMVTAAIAHDDLASDPRTIARVGELLAQHPDRGAFEVAGGRTVGEERTRLLFLECARWPDDARGTAYDHPTWHYAFRPIVRGALPASDSIAGDALEAFALNARVLANPLASDAERAVALCWVMHLAGDIHQPLHSAELFSAAFPQGDRGGTLEFVKDPTTGEAVSLHWFWDDSVQRVGLPDSVAARARELETRHPRSGMKELAARAHARDFPLWARDESYPLAMSAGYPAQLQTGASKETATALPPDYVSAATAAAERRVALAGYRLADLLREALGSK